jgi:hypothetical protein
MDTACSIGPGRTCPAIRELSKIVEMEGTLSHFRFETVHVRLLLCTGCCSSFRFTVALRIVQAVAKTDTQKSFICGHNSTVDRLFKPPCDCSGLKPLPRSTESNPPLARMQLRRKQHMLWLRASNTGSCIGACLDCRSRLACVCLWTGSRSSLDAAGAVGLLRKSCAHLSESAMTLASLLTIDSKRCLKFRSSVLLSS